MSILLRFLPFLIRGFSWLVKTRAGLWIGTVLVWLGINFGTVTILLDPTINALTGFAQGSGGGGTGQYWSVGVAWMGVLNFDRAITMLISAVGVKKALTAGRLFLFKRGIN